MIQFKHNPDYTKALLTLQDKLMCKGTLKMDIGEVDDPNEELFFFPLQVSFDVKGYFSAAMVDYRERLERQAREEIVKRQLRKGREEKKRARKVRGGRSESREVQTCCLVLSFLLAGYKKVLTCPASLGSHPLPPPSHHSPNQAREIIKKCTSLVEKLTLDLSLISSSEVCMKHRPTELCHDGAKLAVEKITDTCRNYQASMVVVTEKDLADMTKTLKKVVTHAKKCVKQAVALADKVMVAKTMALPTLERALVDNGCELFFERLVASGYVDLEGVTLLAPVDDAFLGEGLEGFDEECFGVPVIDGPYNTGDMLQLNGGYTQPRSENERHTIRTRMDLGGRFTFWLKGDSEPRRLVKAIKPDVNVGGGTVVHVVDKILHPSDAL
jgi:hypothetical protein